MAYTPTEWKSGDVITAEKLNNMEEGINNNFESITLYTGPVVINELARKTLSYGECTINLNNNKTVRELIGDKKVIYFYICGASSSSYIIDPIISFNVEEQNIQTNSISLATMINQTNRVDNVSTFTIQGLFYNADEHAPIILGIFAMCE